MRERGADRIRPSSGAIVAGAVLALALGGWWWAIHPPDGPPSGGLTAPNLMLPGGDDLRPGVVGPEPAAGDRVRVAVPGPNGDSWLMLIEPDSRPPYLSADETAALLPSTAGAVLRTGIALAPGEQYVHEGPAPTGDYLLEVACLGDGELAVDVTLPDNRYTRLETTCDGNVAELALSYRPGYAAIQLTAGGRSRLNAAFQISRR